MPRLAKNGAAFRRIAGADGVEAPFGVDGAGSTDANTLSEAGGCITGPTARNARSGIITDERCVESARRGAGFARDMFSPYERPNFAQLQSQRRNPGRSGSKR